MSKAGYGSSGLDFEMRWGATRKELVPIGRAAGRHLAIGETNLYHTASGDDEPVEIRKQNEEHVVTVAHDIAALPPCCARHSRVHQRRISYTSHPTPKTS